MEALNVLRGTIVDIEHRRLFKGTVWFDSHIRAIKEEENTESRFILPGLIDAHVHIESSMLAPAVFARMAVRHGVIAAVSDPHEIANVAGVEGIRFMIQNAANNGFRFLYGAPSCVPATKFETAGAKISAEDIQMLFDGGEVHYLSEVMNVPGVLFCDEELSKKIAVALRLGVPIDGHAPGLRGGSLARYVSAGISTDHECFQIEEAREKLQCGMNILIREGSAAKNFDELIPLLREAPDRIMFCSDDLHPDDLMKGHINVLVSRALSLGYDVFDTLRAASFNPARHYGIDLGLLQVGDRADMIVVDDLVRMKVLKTFIGGVNYWDGFPASQPMEPPVRDCLNRFEARHISVEDLRVPRIGRFIRVMGVTDGSLITKSLVHDVGETTQEVTSQPEQDIIKVLVMNRYQSAAPAIGFLSGTGIKAGALASSVAHDSHNIVAVGSDDESMVRAVNAIVDVKGGISVSCGDTLKVLPLPIAGLMSDWSGEETAAMYSALNVLARSTGCTLASPFMTLSFVPLLVIPELKLSDKGLFDGVSFCPTSLFI